MAGSINRRAFLGRTASATAAVMGAPFIRSSRATAATGDRLVVAVGQWGTETPFAWRTVQAEKPLPRHSDRSSTTPTMASCSG